MAERHVTVLDKIFLAAAFDKILLAAVIGLTYQGIYHFAGLWVMTASSRTEKAMDKSARRFIRQYLKSH